MLAAARPFGLVPAPSPVDGGGGRPHVRTFTFAPDHVREFEVVTSAGAMLRVDADRDPERFHGLRAGRTAFGLVTAMTIDLQPTHGHYAAGLWFRAADAGPVLRRWRTWITDLPPTCSTSLSRLLAADSALVPEPLRGQELLQIRFSFLGDPAEGSRLVAPLRSVAPLLHDTVRETSWEAMDPGSLPSRQPPTAPGGRGHPGHHGSGRHWERAWRSMTRHSVACG